jgi:HEPN domain-containing protein
LSQRSRRLLEEAVRDLEISCYNKAASASYFAVRMLAEETLRQLDEHIPRRGDKLANAIKSKGLRRRGYSHGNLICSWEESRPRSRSGERELAVKLSMEVHKQLERYLEGVRGGRDWKPNTSIPEQRL